MKTQTSGKKMSTSNALSREKPIRNPVGFGIPDEPKPTNEPASVLYIANLFVPRRVRHP